MPKDFMNPRSTIHREMEIQPTDETERLENHILAESFKIGKLDIDKVRQQIGELESKK